MFTRRDAIRLLTPGLRTEFMKAFNSEKAMAKLIYPLVTTEMPSTASKEDYGWLGNTPRLREWKSERAPKALLESGFELVNKHYEASISVDADLIDDDKTGGVNMKVKAMGIANRQDYDTLFSEVLEAGHQTICYDGQYFFDTDHQEGTSPNQSNYSASGMALTAPNLKTVIATMKAYKDDTGRSSKVKPTHLMVPTALEWKANSIIKPAAAMASTDPDLAVLAGALEIIVNPDLTDDTAWYVLDLSGPIAPFIFQNRQPIKFAALDKDDDHDNFMRKEIYYGTDARLAFGFGDWRLAYKAKA